MGTDPLKVTWGNLVNYFSNDIYLSDGKSSITDPRRGQSLGQDIFIYANLGV